MTIQTAKVTAKGAARWAQGHPWIFRSDVTAHPDTPGVCHVSDSRGKFLGTALCSPKSEIRLRLLSRAELVPDTAWWMTQLRAAEARRGPIDATAWRLVHGEGDGLPSLIIDRYDRWIVAQLLSAGLETMRPMILDAVQQLYQPEGILLRNDVPVRRFEGLPEKVELAAGSVPETITIREGGVQYLAAPWSGQKTGAFLDQRTHRQLIGSLTKQGGEALDCFTYHGSFALHLAERARRVTAVDVSGDALQRGAENARLNGRANLEWVEADVFELLRRLERERRHFDTIVLDPPAFAKNRQSVPKALTGYKEINLRALRILAPGGVLLTASCSYHVGREAFMQMLEEAAADSGRRVTITHLLPQGPDHPELLTVPETGYLKGVVLRVE